MDPEMLDTLVRLASAGTSGVCVLAIFWSGVCLQRLPRDAADGRYRSFRLFMAMCVLIALISAGAATANAYFNYKQNRVLTNTNTTLEQSNKSLTGNLKQVKGQLADSKEEGAQLRTQVAALEVVKRRYVELQGTYKALKVPPPQFIDVPGGEMPDRERPQ